MRRETAPHLGAARGNGPAAKPRTRGWVFLHRLLLRHAEESVTDEQVRQMLAPVLAMIHEGRFDRPRAQRKCQAPPHRAPPHRPAIPRPARTTPARTAPMRTTPEQMRRVLAPVLAMIHEGRFDRPRAKSKC